MKRIFFIIALVGIFSSCNNNHDDGHGHENPHEHSVDHIELEVESHTVWTEKTELFVEFKPLIVGKSSTFLAHYTDMNSFKAIENASTSVLLVTDNQELTTSVDLASSPGIFKLMLTPIEAGICELVFQIESGALKDTIVIKTRVFEDERQANLPHLSTKKQGEIPFLKEQAWKIDFSIARVKRQEIHRVIKTSGEIEPMQGDEAIVTAKSSGIVVFSNGQIIIGDKVKGQSILFTISGEGMLHENIDSKIAISRAKHTKALLNFERGNILLADGVISKLEWDDLKEEYDVVKAEYDNLISNYGKGGQKIKAPFTGYVKDILVTEGQYVQSGDAMALVTKNNKLIIKAEVSQKYFSELPNISSANFRTAYDTSVYTIEDFNGRLLTYGKSVGSGEHFLHVYFEIDNIGGVISGSFVDVYLKTKPIESALVIPQTAIMDDYGSHYVFVQVSGETFEKRNVKTGVSDGINVQIVSGLTEGEWVVTKGAYQVKMATMSSAIPAHGHSH